jgi:predicted phage-related endonuclease
MYKVILEDIEINRDEFVALHGTSDHYGGSSVANICGVGYDSPLKEWLRRTGKTEPIQQTDQMRLGSFLEPMLAGMLQKKINLPVENVNQVWQSTERPWMIASVDAVIGFDKEFLGEFKVHKLYADQYWSEESASDSAMCQLQWYLAVSGKEGGFCGALIGGDCEKFYTPFFESDPDLQGQLIESVEKFREFVQSDTPPEAGPGDAKLIQDHLLKDFDKQKEIDLTDKASDRMARYRQLAIETDALTKQLKPLTAEQKEIKNQFLADCQGAGTIIVGKDKVSLTHVKSEAKMSKGKDYMLVTIKMDKGE